MGWRLARPWWGHGYATEAARAALRFAFEVADLDEVVSFTVAANTASRKVMARLGMTHEGETFEHPRLAAGSPWSTQVLYRLTRTVWRATGAFDPGST